MLPVAAATRKSRGHTYRLIAARLGPRPHRKSENTTTLKISGRGLLGHWKWIKTTTIRYTKKVITARFFANTSEARKWAAADNQKINKWKSRGSYKADDAYLHKNTFVEGHSRHLAILIATRRRHISHTATSSTKINGKLWKGGGTLFEKHQ